MSEEKARIRIELWDWRWILDDYSLDMFCMYSC